MSIFGQVWLWSLLAFFVGALVAWLVLVVPARKRVRELEEALASAHAENARTPANAAALAASGRTSVLPPVAAPEEPEPVDSFSSGFAEPDREPAWTRDEREHAPTELIAAAPPAGFDPEAEYDAEYRTAPEPDAEPELSEASAVSSVDSGSMYRAAATEYLSPVSREPDSGYHHGVDEFETADNDTGSGYHRAVEPFESPLEPLAGTLEPASFESRPEPAADEPVSLFQPAAEQSESDWFSKELPDRSPFEEPPGGDYLDEPESTEHLTPAPVAVAAPAEDLEESTEEPAESGGLPKRQPRESPRGGFDPPQPIQPSMRSVERREPDLTGAHSGSLFEPSVQPNQVAALAAPEPPPARDTPEDSVPPGPFGPGSAMPRPGGGRPSDAFTVKASVTALRYCTEESPQFPRMVAEVWFRSSADAERVGFRPLS
ncbi:LapA family protein [Amycolatopsis rhabdoformis]|uniref:LapA family protein n=1 Tax=Amycolatopsis rhabdoformis TaxID=1448059 RepID=A0ABZ1I481_9PSEU|nr:LapA family protein [Amycolatopsis rhabdoformis]WSE29004.1 LapA family protein [Amycolatopsis rhabdoformis]